MEREPSDIGTGSRRFVCPWEERVAFVWSGYILLALLVYLAEGHWKAAQSGALSILLPTIAVVILFALDRRFSAHVPSEIRIEGSTASLRRIVTYARFQIQDVVRLEENVTGPFGWPFVRNWTKVTYRSADIPRVFYLPGDIRDRDLLIQMLFNGQRSGNGQE